MSRRARWRACAAPSPMRRAGSWKADPSTWPWRLASATWALVSWFCVLASWPLGALGANIRR
eukprot:1622620-Alexandrium_andersonii.AAC.1